eukprot:Nk52_evm3s331 gene=Nk52_evmTU3s331
MEQFKTTYLYHCDQNNVEPLQKVLTEIDVNSDHLFPPSTLTDASRAGGGDAPPPLVDPSSETQGKRDKTHNYSSISTNSRIRTDYTLNLSPSNISLKACLALSKALREDSFFTEINLGDCLLGDDGVCLVASALKTNTAVRVLNLRGNNIRSDGAVALGKLLKFNTTLRSLVLEWNCLGVYELGISSIAEGLAMNTALLKLDLRNNQINAAGARALSVGLKQNQTLHTLDLRWNSIGLVGGRSISDALQWNHGLTSLELVGNHVAEDVLRGIQTALQRNRDKEVRKEESRARVVFLSEEVKGLRKDHDHTISRLNETLSKKENEIIDVKNSSRHQVGQLQCALEERKEAFMKLEEAFQQCERSKKLSEKRAEEFLKDAERAQTAELNLQKELVEEKARREREAENSRREISEITKKYLECEAKLRDVELKLDVSLKDVGRYRSELESFEDKEQAKLRTMDERLHGQEKQHQKMVSELKDLLESDIATLKEEYENRVKTLQDRLKTASEAEQQVKREMNELQASYEEKIKACERQGREMEGRAVERMEERIRHANGEKDRVQAMYTQQQEALNDCKGRIEQLEREMKTQRKHSEDLLEEAANLSSALKSDVTRLKTENKRIGEERNKMASQESSLRAKITELNDEVIQVKAKDSLIQQLRTEIEIKNKEIHSLKANINKLEMKLDDFQADQMRGLNALENAISSYVSAAKSKYSK